MAQVAPGLPDPAVFGRYSDIPPNSLVDYFIQKHDAERSGSHKDIRFGTPRTGLYSWATKKPIPKPGERRMWYQQPIHDYDYGSFSGQLERGYGKGTVELTDSGKLLVTDMTPNYIRFITAGKSPERFVAIRTTGKATTGTSRTKQTQGGSWLVVNTTPTNSVEYKKPKFKKVDTKDIDKFFSDDFVLSEKIDGAHAIVQLLNDSANVLSYRKSKDGRPINYTYKIDLPRKLNIPAKYRNTLLIGELYGSKRGKSIPAAELGGILNATLANAIQKKNRDRINLRLALFGAGKDWTDMPYDKRREAVQGALDFLPPEVFHEPEYAETEEQKRKLWESITSGTNQRTEEGVVAYPRAGGTPSKLKLMDDFDVVIRNLIPGEGKYSGRGVGGFEYSDTADSPILGRVGTGFDDATREDMYTNPGTYLGRTARVKAQGRFPSGAYRVPAFISLHEDY